MYFCLVRKFILLLPCQQSIFAGVIENTKNGKDNAKKILIKNASQIPICSTIMLNSIMFFRMLCILPIMSIDDVEFQNRRRKLFAYSGWWFIILIYWVASNLPSTSNPLSHQSLITWTLFLLFYHLENLNYWFRRTKKQTTVWSKHSKGILFLKNTLYAFTITKVNGNRKTLGTIKPTFLVCFVKSLIKSCFLYDLCTKF